MHISTTHLTYYDYFFFYAQSLFFDPFAVEVCLDQHQKFESRNEMARRYYIARVKCVGSNCRGNYAASLRRRPLSM